MTQTLSGEEETVLAGSAFAAGLGSGSVVALTGDLGAGKTCFSRGIAKGLGYTGEVSSPTFSLVHEYPGERLSIFHFDFYRLESVEELLDIGWEEYLSQDGVVIAEWADKFREALPDDAIWVLLSHSSGGPGTRVLTR
jgi:tRNA threonylcarbamoyladenosine biosynthesis protein TsaE